MENNFYIKIENPINVDSEDDEYSITSKINNKIEEIITKNPGEWIWTHDRWRIQFEEITKSGSTGTLLQYNLKSKCGPVDLPVDPTVAIISPFFTN